MLKGLNQAQIFPNETLKPDESVYDSKEGQPDSTFELSEQDRELLDSLVLSQRNDWKKISRKFFLATDRRIDPNQLRLKYKEQASPKTYAKNHRFTLEEIKKIEALVKEHGTNWEKIAESFPTLDPMALKNRYFFSVRAKRFKNKVWHKKKRRIKPVLNFKALNNDKINLATLISEIKLNNPPLCLKVIEKLLKKRRLKEIVYGYSGS